MAHEEHSRRDDAGVGPYARHDARLVPLGELSGWDVVDDDPDIRGWEVRTLSGRVVGEVKDLLVDKDEGEVVMMEIDVKGSTGHTLAPIRAAQVDRVERIVRIDSADLAEEELPEVARREQADDVGGAGAHRRAEDRAGDRGSRIRVGDRRVGERVIEQRPVVVEETVVRRRVLGDEPDTGTESRRAAEEQRDRPDEAR